MIQLDDEFDNHSLIFYTLLLQAPEQPFYILIQMLKPAIKFATSYEKWIWLSMSKPIVKFSDNVARYQLRKQIVMVIILYGEQGVHRYQRQLDVWQSHKRF